MAIRDYRTLVNDAIVECKVTLDSLTTDNFASPPRTGLYNSFKRWANKAYRDLMLERTEWFFRTERTAISLRPRLHVVGLTYIPSVGDVLVGAVSGVRFTVRGVHSFEDNEVDTQVERTLSVEYTAGDTPQNLRPLEVLNRTAPSVASAVGVVRFAGRYNLADDVVGLDRLDLDSVRVFLNATDLVSVALLPLEWSNRATTCGSSPRYITRAPDGNYELFPQPIAAFTLQFDYSRKYSDMALATDLPIGVPEPYEDILLWKVVREYADFDNNGKLFKRAEKNIDMYCYFLDRDTTQAPSLAPSKFG